MPSLRSVPVLLVTVVVTACPPPSEDEGTGGAEPGSGTEGSGPPGAVTGAIRQMVESGRITLPGGASVDIDARADSFYTSRSGRPLWLENGRSRRLLDALAALSSEALDVRAADPGHLARLEEALGRTGTRARARAELLASEAFLTAATGLVRGAEDPRAAGFQWRIPRDPLPGSGVLEDVAHGTPPSEVFDGLRPEPPYYGRMVEALARTRAVSDRGGWPGVEGDGTVEVGDTSDVAGAVRARLAAGVDSTERRRARVGGGIPRVYDDSLAAAVEHFQRRHGLAVDGVLGPETIAALDVSTAERVDALEANLERLRWMPRDLGERSVLVNVAGFQLEGLERNRPVMEMDVVAGRPEWRTRIFADTMTHLVFNPYWNVPESIEAEEILPAVLEDRTYLREKRLEIVREDEPFGEPVDPSTVDWSGTAAETFPWDFRQRPGPENSLGQVKFMLPNPYAIYLHDTPADRLFDRSTRAFSHGCIRVERPWDLARWVLAGTTDRPAAEVARLRDDGGRTRVDLDRPVPVYIVYLTAWVDSAGVVAFHPDIYDRDEALEPLVAPR